MTIDITKVRLLTNEPFPGGSLGLDDVDIAEYLVEYGNDVNWLCSDLWAMKASVIQATALDTSADGSSFSLSQAYDHAIERAKYFSGKRKPTTTRWIKDPIESGNETYVPLEEDDGTI